MHVVVIGAGVVGITTAYFLREHGIAVTVLDGEPEPALGASYGNGGYYQVGVPDPWNAPGAMMLFMRALLASIAGKADKSPFAVRPGSIPRLFGWGMRFAQHCDEQTFLDHLIKNKNLAEYSQAVVKDLLGKESIEYSRLTSGALIIFRDQTAMDAYARVAGHAGQHGTRFDVLDRPALLAKEPALTDIGEQLAGAVFFPDDSGGNPRSFCLQLASVSRDRGVDYHFDWEVQRISRVERTIRVEGPRGDITADSVVIATGARSAGLAAQLGIRLPVAPAKGYSVSIPMADWSNPPRHIIADMGVHAGLNPMGDVLRVAGTAEFTGFHPGFSSARVEYMIDLVRAIFPTFAETIDAKQIDPWAGHRPLSADGIPMIGATGVDGVYVNTGHGGLGWTQAPGSSRALADLIAGVESGLDLSDYAVSRFN